LKKHLFKKKNKEIFRINDKIIASEVRLVGSNIKIGIYKTNLAIEIAKKTRT
jgi:translation initiation factor IF-3